MSSKLSGILGGLVACLLGAVSFAEADTVDAFGLTHSSVGDANLSWDSAARRLSVTNIGSSGQDGVEVRLSDVQTPDQDFSLDFFLDDLSTAPNGFYFQSTVRGITGSGTIQDMSIVRSTKVADNEYLLAASFPLPPNNQPLTIEYRSGGPNGTLRYVEQYVGNTPTLLSVKWPDTLYIDSHFDPPHFSGGFDWNHGSGSLRSALGVDLSALNIDFLDILAPSNAPPQYSTAYLTAGGVSSFTIINEVVSVPEPSTLAMLGVGCLGVLGCVWRKRKLCPSSAC